MHKFNEWDSNDRYTQWEFQTHTKWKLGAAYSWTKSSGSLFNSSTALSGYSEEHGRDSHSCYRLMYPTVLWVRLKWSTSSASPFWMAWNLHSKKGTSYRFSATMFRKSHTTSFIPILKGTISDPPYFTFFRIPRFFGIFRKKITIV